MNIVLPITIGILSFIIRTTGWFNEPKPSTIPPTNNNPNILSPHPPIPSNNNLTSPQLPPTPRRIRTEENKYEHRSSRLDLHGDLIRPFRAPESNYTQSRRGSTFGILSPTPSTSTNVVPSSSTTSSDRSHSSTTSLGITFGNDMIGWYNLMIVVLFTYVVSNAIHACIETTHRIAAEQGLSSSPFSTSSSNLPKWLYNQTKLIYTCLDISTWFLDQGVTATNLFTHTPALVRDITILFFCYLFLSYGIQSAIKHKIFTRRWIILLLQSIAESALFFGPCIYARTIACISWPVTQRFAFLMEAAVLTMKMHSYFTVNRHLAKEISLGGPGTGEKVLEAATLEAKKERELQLQQTNDITNNRIQSPTPTSPMVTEVRPPTSFTTYLYSLFQALNSHIRKESNIEALEAAANIGRASGTSIGISNFIPTVMTTEAIKKGRESGESTTQHDGQPTKADVVPSSPNLSSEPTVSQSTSSKHLPRTSSSSHLRALQWIKQAAETTTGSIQSFIHGKSDQGRSTILMQIRYPDNITFKDFFNYSIAPTLCYEPNYPRTDIIEIAYIVEKIFLATGLIFAGLYIFSNYMVPVLQIINRLSIIDALAQLILPTTAVTLVIFFVIFECILNACAELTYFADRSYYHDWWNSTSFAEFSRKWNTPVHEFLLRHIFLDTMLRRGASPTIALYLTYIISILIHEFIIWGALGIVTPYLGILSTVQFPLMTLLRLPIFRGRRLGNMFFWAGLMIGITLVLILYSKDYYQLQHQDPLNSIIQLTIVKENVLNQLRLLGIQLVTFYNTIIIPLFGTIKAFIIHFCSSSTIPKSISSTTTEF